MKRCIRSFFAFFLLTGMLAIPLSSFSQTKPSFLAEPSSGLLVARLVTPQGIVRINFPDDMAAGDTISGTVSVEPNGATEAERQQNQGILNGYVIDLGEDAKINVDRPQFTWTPQAAQPSTPNRFVLKVVELLGPDKKSVASAGVPIITSPGTIPADFTIPTLGQTGRPITITGPFDGDAANTSCTLGGQPAAIMVESPRQLMVKAPINITGVTEIQVKEGNASAAGEFRNIGINLSAPKTNLTKGEKTTVTTQVTGLQGITTGIPLNITTTGAVTMQGGTTQNIQINPNQVSGGTYTQTNNLTGIQAGNFNVTATVLQPCNLTGQLVHVESAYGGSAGDWVIGIKTQSGATGWIHIPSTEEPGLQYCNWIRIKKCHSDEIGRIWVDDYEKTQPPPPPPPTPTPTPKPTPIVTPTPVPPTTPPSDPTTPGTPTVTPTPKPPTAPADPGNPTTTTKPPCKEGAVRNAKAETKEFEIMDEASDLSFTLSHDKQAAQAAAQNMADWFKKAGNVGGLLKKLFPKGVGAGGTAAGLLLKYLDAGGDILDALAKSKLANANVMEVTVSLTITTKKIKATCTTYEICRNGAWVTEKKYEESVGQGTFRKSKTVTPTDNDWDKVANSSTARFDPAKAEQWAKDWLKYQLNILKKNEEEYEAFKQNCK